MGYTGQATIERTAEELLQEYERTGRAEPFEEIVRRYSGMVFHVCHRITRDRHDAEDATQKVFAALAVGRNKSTGDIRAIGPWLRQVARRISLDIRRGAKRRQRRETLCATTGAIAAAPQPEASYAGFDADEIRQIVKDELDLLPLKYRMPLVLHYFGGMSQDDMARELHCRPGTLRVRLHRARHMLAKRLAKRGVAIGTLGAVAFVVALSRAVQSTVADSVTIHLGYSHAASAAGGVTRVASAPVTIAHSVAMSKFKIACALVLIGACVVRAGAEVYQYIRPLQMHLPFRPTFDRLIQPLFDPFPESFHVDATPIKPAFNKTSPAAIPLPRVEPVLTSIPVPSRFTPPPVQIVTPPVSPVAIAAPSLHLPQQANPFVIDRPLGRLGPDFSRTVAVSHSDSLSDLASPSPAATASRALASTIHVSFPTPIPTPTPVTPISPVPSQPEPPATPPVAENPTPTPTPVSPAPTTPEPVALATVVIHPATIVTVSPTLPATSTGVVATTNAFIANADVTGSQIPSGPKMEVVTAQSQSVVASSIQQTSTTLTGHGVAAAANLDNSGVVTATAPALDLSQIASVTNSQDNPPSGPNGWYAASDAKLLLPKLAVAAGTHAYSWGENQDDSTPDLVNSVRLTLYDVASPGDVQIALVSPDLPGLPAFPAGQHVIGLWSYNSDTTDSGADLLVRFDALKAASLGGTDADIRLLDYNQGWQSIDNSSIFPGDHLISGHVGSMTYFAVSIPSESTSQFAVSSYLRFPGTSFVTVTPEPAGFGVILATFSLLLRRRNRKM